MALSFFACQEGRVLIIGLSTDGKPSPNNDGWMFIEINTGKMFYSESGQWKENQRQETGTLIFANEKTKSVLFSSPFSSVPEILFSNNASAGTVNYKTNVTVNGFTMNFATKYTGTVDFVAKQKP